jgi:hypothetical protein
MERPPTKWKWKAMLNKAVEEHHMTEWYNEVEDKTSLKYLTLVLELSIKHCMRISVLLIISSTVSLL